MTDHQMSYMFNAYDPISSLHPVCMQPALVAPEAPTRDIAGQLIATHMHIANQRYITSLQALKAAIDLWKEHCGGSLPPVTEVYYNLCRGDILLASKSTELAEAAYQLAIDAADSLPLSCPDRCRPNLAM
ncbi:hypothetical protein KIPB_003739, partial [Kipferlia bialata]|eukprot:g3739.t1